MVYTIHTHALSFSSSPSSSPSSPSNIRLFLPRLLLPRLLLPRLLLPPLRYDTSDFAFGFRRWIVSTFHVALPLFVGRFWWCPYVPHKVRNGWVECAPTYRTRWGTFGGMDGWGRGEGGVGMNEVDWNLHNMYSSISQCTRVRESLFSISRILLPLIPLLPLLPPCRSFFLSIYLSFSFFSSFSFFFVFLLNSKGEAHHMCGCADQCGQGAGTDGRRSAQDPQRVLHRPYQGV